MRGERPMELRRLAVAMRAAATCRPDHDRPPVVKKAPLSGTVLPAHTAHLATGGRRVPRCLFAVCFWLWSPST